MSEAKSTPIELAHEEFVLPSDGARLGMWLFLASEIMLFGGLFASYALLRSKHPELFHEAHLELNRTLGTLNTGLLITSSLTMALAVKASQESKRRLTTLFLSLTIAFGLLFGMNKYFEYAEKFAHHIQPGTNLFFGLYFSMTGLHMIHVFVGIGVLGVILAMNLRGRFSEHYFVPVENAGLYWHLVDLIWIYLFPLLYLIG